MSFVNILRSWIFTFYFMHKKDNEYITNAFKAELKYYISLESQQSEAHPIPSRLYSELKVMT